jgi:hypothetical protein
MTHTSSVATGTGLAGAFVFKDTALSSGDMMYATASAITSGNILNLGKGGTTAFSGNVINVDANNYGGGTFTGNFIKLLRNGSTVFLVDNLGNATIRGVTYAWPAADAAGVLTSNGSGTLSWGAASGTNYWALGSGTIYPGNTTLDLLIGASATTSAKFAFKNVLTGTPTASISGTAPAATFIDGNGNISMTARKDLTLGNSATYNTTGNILLNPNGTGNVGIGTTTPTTMLHLAKPVSNIYQPMDTSQDAILLENSSSSGSLYTPMVRFKNNDPTWSGYGAGIYGWANQISIITTTDNWGTSDSSNWIGTSGIQFSPGTGNIVLLTDSNSNLNVGSGQLFVNGNTGNVGIGTTSPLATLHVAGKYGGNAAAIINQTLAGDIFTASASGTTKMTLANDGTLNLYNASSTISNTSGNITITPNSNLLIIAANASASGTLTLGNGQSIRPAYGPLTLNYKSGADAWSAGLSLTNSGFVGIGTTNPTSKLDVSDNSTSTASAMIRNTTTTAGTTGLAIKMSATTPGTTTRWIDFLNLNGTNIGKVISLSTTTITYSGNGTDMAEYFTKDDPNATFATGTVMCQGPNGVLACSASTPDKIVGIVSDSPSFLGGVEGPNKVVVSLTGQIPVLISPTSPDIQPGDLLTVADNGLATKAIRPGFVVGKAQKAWSASSGDSSIRVITSYIWADPTLAITNSGNLNIAQTQDGSYELTDSSNNNSVIDKIGAFAEVVTANVKAGAAIASQITTDGFIAFQGTIDNLLIKSGLVAGNIQTKLISPLADGTDVTVQVGTATESGKFAIINGQGTEVASIDSAGNATFSATLYANEIKSKSLDDIQALLTSVQTDQNLLKDAVNWNVLTATNSASLGQLAVTDLYVTNQAAINSLSVTNTLTIGSDLVFQSQTTDHGSPFTSIDTLSAPLKLQSLAMAPLEIMAGLVTIDTHGNVNIAGDLYVAGRIKSSGLTLTDNQKYASDSAKLLTLVDQSGNEVSSVNASGSAQFGSVSTPQLVIVGADATVSGLIVNGIITTNSTVGQAIIPAGTSEITIKNPKVTDYTLIYVTPTSSTQNNVLYVKSKQTGQFVVGFTNPIDTDTNFNWWIIQITQ